MKYNLSDISDYLEGDYVIAQRHPTLPLLIYNYSRTTQYSGIWDDITLNCRGLVLDLEGNVIAKPFPKFFNYEEHAAEGSKLPPIPSESFEVYEKMDGSLGIIFHYEGEWLIATRGSFTSEQSIKGKEMLDKLPLDVLDTNNTYLAEIIYPENRIVVDYGTDEKLVLLGAYNNETGEEVKIEAMSGWEVVKMYKTWGEDWKTLKKEISKDNEGYVIRFSGGMRMKIKGDEYVRLHRILTNFSTKDIWELLKNGEDLGPFLERVPDEFDDWVKRTAMNLRYSFHSIDERAGKYHDSFRYGKYNDKEVEPTKKEFAEYVKQFPKELSAVMFKMWDKQPYDHIIWSMIKPKYEKPFRNNDE
jgi:T4 RnlA family RNA ligase